MKVLDTALAGVKIVEPTVFGDNRGWFYEVYNQQAFREAGIDVQFVQDNHSYSAQIGTVRGIHFQNNPYCQAKLVRCTRGYITDIVVDLRPTSPTYRQWLAVDLTQDNKRQLFIPHGFGHGFVTRSADVEIQYKVDALYNKACDRSILWCDPAIGVDWGVETPILSDKDKNAPLLKDSDINF